MREKNGMLSMAQVLARGGVVSKEEADRVDRKKEAQQKRLNGMEAKLKHLERDIRVIRAAMDEDTKKIALDGELSAVEKDIKLLAISSEADRRIANIRKEMGSIQASIMHLSEKK